MVAITVFVTQLTSYFGNRCVRVLQELSRYFCTRVFDDFGIGGVLTFKNAKKLVNVLPKIPNEKLIIETDGPYLTPTPHRGQRNEPIYTTFVAQKMSEILDVDIEEIENTTTNNALKLFNIL